MNIIEKYKSDAFVCSY